MAWYLIDTFPRSSVRGARCYGARGDALTAEPSAASVGQGQVQESQAAHTGETHLSKSATHVVAARTI
eukprot:4496124-Prymnesium_polylepis.1